MSEQHTEGVSAVVYVMAYLSWNVCTETTHYFDRRPGTCRCGRETWGPEPPKLRAVK